MSDRPISSLRARAAGRAAALRTRVNLMAVVSAMSAHQVVCIAHQSAVAERRGRALEMQVRIDDLRADLAAGKDLLSEAKSAGARSALSSDDVADLESQIAVLEGRLAAAVRERGFALEALNDKIAELAIQRGNADRDLSAAMTLAAIKGAPLPELVRLVGLPEAVEVLATTSIAERARRAAVLLEATRIESSRAAEELARVGSSIAYDCAFSALIEAEEIHTHMRRVLSEARAREADAFRALCEAQRAVSGVDRIIPLPMHVANPGETSREALDRPAAGSAAESDPGDQQPDATPGDAAHPVSATERELASGPRSEANSEAEPEDECDEDLDEAAITPEVAHS